MAPDDQSGWMYHRWLIAEGDDPVALEREIKVIEEILQEEPESRCKSTLSFQKTENLIL